jgi:putative chitinase
MLLSINQLTKIYQFAPLKRLKKFLPHIRATLERFEINTPQRIRMFLAQIGHESGELRFVREIATGEAYEGREDLGNTQDGDGVRYKGRGLIQITGRRNYEQCAEYFGLPLLENPELLESPELATLAAGWFWYRNNLNSLADSGDFIKVTKRINGGTNGLKDRQRLYALACKYIA